MNDLEAIITLTSVVKDNTYVLLEVWQNIPGYPIISTKYWFGPMILQMYLEDALGDFALEMIDILPNENLPEKFYLAAKVAYSPGDQSAGISDYYYFDYDLSNVIKKEGTY